MNKLTDKKCVACEGGEIKPIPKSEAERLILEIEGWIIDTKGKKINKE